MVSVSQVWSSVDHMSGSRLILTQDTLLHCSSAPVRAAQSRTVLRVECERALITAWEQVEDTALLAPHYLLITHHHQASPALGKYKIHTCGGGGLA